MDRRSRTRHDTHFGTRVRPAARTLAGPAGDLTLRDVIELHRTGLGEDLLIAVIDADGGPFPLSFADIQDLKSDGLSERVIAALVRTGTRRASTSGAGAPAWWSRCSRRSSPTWFLRSCSVDSSGDTTGTPPGPRPPATRLRPPRG